MNTAGLERWLDDALPKHARLTDVVMSIVENVLRARDIEYLAITGRTKQRPAVLEKIKRKGYTNPRLQLTDLSGIRVVVYLESDVRRVSAAIRETFAVDAKNSLDRDDLLSANQVGYRSVHYVCDLGPGRASLPEFIGLDGLKFEFQIRTVLQHAWAELAHDRNYKFSGKLPRALERKLYLYAGMLEIADKGFDEVSTEFDQYAAKVTRQADHGDLNVEITSVSLEHFIDQWAHENDIVLTEPYAPKGDLSDLINELEQFGIHTLAELHSIMPANYAELVRDDEDNTIYGVVRDWMLIKDWRHFKKTVHFEWTMDSLSPFHQVFDQKELRKFAKAFSVTTDWDED